MGTSVTTPRPDLTAAYQAWHDKLTECLATQGEKAGYEQTIHACLAPFGPHRREMRLLKVTVNELPHGYHLVAAAVHWEKPLAGVSPSRKQSRTDRSRGRQWRLVMAYSGFETLARALTRSADSGLTDSAINHLLQQLPLPTYAPHTIAAPISDPSQLTHLRTIIRLKSANAQRLASFLHGQPISSYASALRLARLFRHATAHGSLSPNKVQELKLGKTLDRLVQDIGLVTAACFDCLAT